MIPLQTEVDSALDALFAAGGAFLDRYWWALVIAGLAVYLRWYAIAKQQGGHEWPELAGLWATIRYSTYTGRRILTLVVITGTVVITELAWGFDILSTIYAGVVTGDPTVVAALTTAFTAVSNGLTDLGWRSYTFRETVWVAGGTYALIIGGKFVYGWAQSVEDAADDDDGGDD